MSQDQLNPKKLPENTKRRFLLAGAGTTALLGVAMTQPSMAQPSPDPIPPKTEILGTKSETIKQFSNTDLNTAKIVILMSTDSNDGKKAMKRAIQITAAGKDYIFVSAEEVVGVDTDAAPKLKDMLPKYTDPSIYKKVRDESQNSKSAMFNINGLDGLSVVDAQQLNAGGISVIR